MQVIDTIAAFRKALDSERAAGRTVGLVPTMGYLHEGHVSLVRRAKAECDVVEVDSRQAAHASTRRRGGLAGRCRRGGAAQLLDLSLLLDLG